MVWMALVSRHSAQKAEGAFAHTLSMQFPIHMDNQPENVSNLCPILISTNVCMYKWQIVDHHFFSTGAIYIWRPHR